MQTEHAAIGGLWSLQAPDRFGRRVDEVLDESLSQMAYAESLGLSMAWLTEHHFEEDGYCPSPLVMAAAIAARTTTLRIGVGINLMPLYGHPLRLAEDVAFLSQLSRGRFELGVGQGYRRHEYEGFGIDFDERAERFYEGMELLSSALRGDVVEHDGQHYAATAIGIRPRVYGEVPLWQGASVRAGFERVARMGSHLVLAPTARFATVRDQVSEFRDVWREEHGTDRAPTVAVMREFYVADSDEEAWTEVAPYFRYVYGVTYGPPWTNYKKVLPTGERVPVTDPDDPYFGSEEFRKDRFIIGGIETCRRDLKQYVEEVGADQVVLRFQFPGQPDWQVRKSLELLFREVLPGLR